MLKKYVTAMAVLIALGGHAIAQTAYPNRLITLVVPFPAGGASDTIVRLLAQRLSQDLGQTVIIDNKPGANGMIGLSAVARAAPDGYTLGLGATATLGLNPGLRKLPYDPDKDLRMVAQIASAKNVLLVGSSTSIESLADLVKTAKTKPNELNYGSPGVGHSYHLMGELLKQTADIGITHVPYKGDSAALQDLVAGRIQMMFAPVTAALPFIAANNVRALAVSAGERSDKLPSVPTFNELNWKGFEVGSWFGIVAPGKTPDQVVVTLDKAIAKALESDELRKAYDQLGIDVSYASTVEFSAFVESEKKKWSKVIKSLDLKLD